MLANFPSSPKKQLNTSVGEESLAGAVKAVAERVSSEIDPATDLHATAEYRRSITRGLDRPIAD